ncbi:hypothetical protein IW249_004275 [Micromonospora vinacea]|uniref:Uncharacterized protein n=1 Tax=Micromonospora vinacea TaxID=709878 RepID=A0ABS0K5W3_9ACTN|nr:hypothetical protein [Micromonospora vinacea]MBG6103861.1 hypothetical protein [Micromonospora vinacea]
MEIICTGEVYEIRAFTEYHNLCQMLCDEAFRSAFPDVPRTLGLESCRTALGGDDLPGCVFATKPPEPGGTNGP